MALTPVSPGPGADRLSPLASLLRCLRCRGELALDDERERGADARPGSGPRAGREPALVCSRCGARYRVAAGTVRMLGASPGADAAEGEVKRRTAQSFAYEWERFGQLRPEWRKNFRDYLRPLEEADLRGWLVLDVGCGSGRHSFQAAAAGARVVSADLGRSIDVARRNLPPEVLTVQADAEELPFEPGTFDLVMCIGVLHHLPDPGRALRRLARLARPGGHVHVYLYWRPESRVQRAILGAVAAARRVTRRLPHPVLHALCYPLAGALWLAVVLPHRLARGRPRLARLVAGLPLKTYADYPFGVLVNDQFDRFSAPLERRYRRSEVEELMAAAGLVDVHVLPNAGWVADGRAPAGAAGAAR